MLNPRSKWEVSCDLTYLNVDNVCENRVNVSNDGRGRGRGRCGRDNISDSGGVVVKLKIRVYT